jgi:hypothetical protein
MLHAAVSIIIAADPSVVKKEYLDYVNWHQLFPLTIKRAKLVKEENGRLTVEVDHRYEGKVINIISVLSPEEIQLQEFKPKFNAVFINRFEKIPSGTLYTLSADVSLNGIFKLATPFVRKLLKRRMLNYVLYPMKKYSESHARRKSGLRFYYTSR